MKALQPKISDSGFQLEDLFWDDAQKNIRARETKVLRTFRLVIARNIPLPAEGWNYQVSPGIHVFIGSEKEIENHAVYFHTKPNSRLGIDPTIYEPNRGRFQR